MTCPVFGVHYISHASGKEFTINDPEVIEHLFDYAFDPIAFDYIIKKLTKNYGVDREIIFHLMSDHASAQGWVHMTLEDFFAQPHAPLSWVVDGVFTQIGASIISSPPKAGKTTLMRWLAYCVATGREWLQRKTQKTPVLYVGNEENRAALYESLATFKNVFGPVDPKHFYLSFGIPIKRLFLQFMEERL